MATEIAVKDCIPNVMEDSRLKNCG